MQPPVATAVDEPRSLRRGPSPAGAPSRTPCRTATHWSTRLLTYVPSPRRTSSTLICDKRAHRLAQRPARDTQPICQLLFGWQPFTRCQFSRADHPRMLSIAFEVTLTTNLQCFVLWHRELAAPRPATLPDLIIRSLAAHDDAPCIFLGRPGRVRMQRSGAEPSAHPGPASPGRRRGTRLAVLSKNRPEVLTNLTASLINGCVITPLHPMASLADHAYVDRRRRDRVPRVRHRQLHGTCGGAEGAVPEPHAAGLRAQRRRPRLPRRSADRFEPLPLERPDVGLDDLCTVVYTSSAGRPKGVLMTHRVWQAMTCDPDGRVGVPRRLADRDRDAAVARRCRSSLRCCCREARST